MKIKMVAMWVFIIVALGTSQLFSGMELSVKELKPAHTITVEDGSVASIAFDKNEMVANFLVLNNNKKCLRRYDLSTKVISTDELNIKNNGEFKDNFDHKQNKCGLYVLHSKDNRTEIWETATKKPLYTFLHSAPIELAVFNNSATQLITSSKGIVNIWDLKPPIHLICGEDRVLISDIEYNWNILKQFGTIKSMLNDFELATLDCEISLSKVTNRTEFNYLFNLVRLAHGNDIQKIKVELKKLSINQLCILMEQSSFHDIVNLTPLICEAIADKCDQKQDYFFIKQLPLDLQRLIVIHKAGALIHYIDHNIRPLSLVGGPISCVAISKNGQDLLVGCLLQNKVKLFDVAGNLKKVFKGHAGVVNFGIFDSDGKTFTTGSSDGTVKIWNAATGECIKTFEHTSPVCAGAYNSDGTIIAVGLNNGNVLQWDVKTGALIKIIIRAHGGCVCSIAYNPNDKEFVTGSDDQTVKIWDAQTGESLHVLEHEDSIYTVGYSPDGQKIVTRLDVQSASDWLSQKGISAVWNSQTGTLLCGGDKSILYDTDWNTVMSSSNDCTATISRTGKVTKIIKDFPWHISLGTGHLDDKKILSGALVCSSNGNTIVLGSYGEIKIWNVGDESKEALCKNITIDQVGLLDKIFLTIREENKVSKKIFEIMKNSEYYAVWMTFSAEAQKYLQHYVEIV